MKARLLLGAGVAALAAFMSSPASAGDYHTGANLYCGQCHVMHYSQSHGYNPDGTGNFGALGAGGPFKYLLRDEVNNLCLSCHDNSGTAPDVYGPVNTGNEPTDVRNAGYLNRLGKDSLSGAGHTLDSLAVAPGSSPSWKPEDDNGTGEGLNCINCHHQHGYAGRTGGVANNAYRNLKIDVGNWTGSATDLALVDYNDKSIGTVDLTKDVFERQAAYYDESGMDWCEPDTSANLSKGSAIGYWCGGCHSNFHGDPGGGNIGGSASGAGYIGFLRHPVAGVDIGAVGGGHSSLSIYNARTNKVKVMSKSGVWGPTAASDVTPTCISCHKAHGNGNAFGLIYRSGGGTLTENGDTLGTQEESLCAQCHTQASYYAKS